MQVATNGGERQGARESKREYEPRRTLDDLAELAAEELNALYAKGGVPEHFAQLDGDLVGRMLAVRSAGHGSLFRALASFAKGPSFPWAGKSFQATDAKAGKGINRIRLGGRHRVFPFRTYAAPSVVDGKPCVVIDYDDPDNPGVIRAVHDEVREIAPGLFLGPACWKRTPANAVVVLWFALDARGCDRGPRAA